MGDLFTIPTPMVTGAFTSSSFTELKMWLKSHQDKQYFTVSNNPNTGQFQTISSAISAIDEGSGAVILIKNGDYEVGTTIDISKKSVVLVGESKEEVTITCTADLSTTGMFNNPTYDSSNTANLSLSNITFDGDSTNSILFNFNDRNGTLFIDNCYINNFVGEEISEATIYSTGCKMCTISNNIIYACAYYKLIGLHTWDNSKVFVEGNLIYGAVDTMLAPSSSWSAQYIGIYNQYSSSGKSSVTVRDNKFFDVCDSVISIDSAVDIATVTNNEIYSNYFTASDPYLNAINCVAKKSLVSWNLIKVLASNATGWMYGITTNQTGRSVVENNDIALVTNEDSGWVGVFGIRVGYQSKASNNTIEISVTGTVTSGDVIGIYLYQDESKAIGNNIDLNDVLLSEGIYSPYDNCYYSGNTLKDCVTDINDTGTGNVSDSNVSV